LPSAGLSISIEFCISSSDKSVGIVLNEKFLYVEERYVKVCGKSGEGVDGEMLKCHAWLLKLYVKSAAILEKS
jgi:hypothetical protein